MREEALPRRYDPNSIGYAVFAWHDLNGNRTWEVGETNRDPGQT